jgi:hypothetical protein
LQKVEEDVIIFIEIKISTLLFAIRMMALLVETSSFGFVKEKCKKERKDEKSTKRAVLRFSLKTKEVFLGEKSVRSCEY